MNYLGRPIQILEGKTAGDGITGDHVLAMIERLGYPAEMSDVIVRENLLPAALLDRLHAQYPQHSALRDATPVFFGPERQLYAGLKGFRDVVAVLERHGVSIGHLEERELFIRVYRFMATRHVLNAVDWSRFATDSLFQLVFPQPGMIAAPTVAAYLNAADDDERQRIVTDYIREHTNPHDGNQLLNKPWFVNDEGVLEFVEGSQHKYPQCQLIFDQSTQACFAFCTYCFRHAQVRGDEDMFLQRDIRQVHAYLRRHPEVTDVLITGGDAGYLPAERLAQYALPILEDPELRHIRAIRLGSRALSYNPERILEPAFQPMLDLFRRIVDSGVQIAWMSHFSTPREVLNPGTIAAIRRLQAHGVVVRSQSPIMKHISLFLDDEGRVDVDRSAQNWIDLANLLGSLRCGFHSMYCARPTGEHHYFAAPLADIERIAAKIPRSLASIHRPSRYVSMTSSAGKISLLGTVDVGGRQAFALKFTQGRNMEWMDKVFLAAWDPEQNTIDKLEPFDTPEFFFREDQRRIEQGLLEAINKRLT